MAAAQYGIDFLQSWNNYQDKIVDLVLDAVHHGAELLVFPEYGAIELASLYPPEIHGHLERQLVQLQRELPQFLELYHELARRHNLYVIAPSFPVLVAGEFRNRAHLFSPSGAQDFQEKLIMTRFENEEWLVRPGQGVKVFDTQAGRLAINVCYDVEFPLLARAQAQAGAQVICVPSCTDTLAGYHRVRIAAQARALENQCYVVQSPTVGEAPWSPALDLNVGAAGVFTASDRGFPDDGVLAIGTLNAVQWLYATLDLDLIDQVRRDGQVFNFRDWDRQATIGAAIAVRLD